MRCLTTLERAQIQTFPKSFIFPGSKTDSEQVIGNAVPVKLAEYVASHLANHIHDEAKITNTQFTLFQKQVSYEMISPVIPLANQPQL
jgi:DNA (cytosine-5)-methyltransferase 1